ncbi:MAG: hypothetical protein WB579_18030 [Bryobacteraceae bacterium]
MNTFSQGNESWKQVTKGVTVYAYNPGWNAAEGTLQGAAPESVDGAEDAWPYSRATPNPRSGRILKSLISARPANR